MARKIDKAKIADPDGEAWHAEARLRWRSAERVALAVGGETIDHYQPVPLPDFDAGKPSHVSRQLLGRFIVERGSGIVHDCYAATPECALDAMADCTFYHFWSELPGEETPCPDCIGS